MMDRMTEVQMTEVEMSTEDVVSFDGPLFTVRSERHQRYHSRAHTYPLGGVYLDYRCMPITVIAGRCAARQELLQRGRPVAEHVE